MTKARKMCFDRILPRDLYKRQRTRMLPGGREEAISLIGKQWLNGSTLRIRFLDGTPAQQDLVRQFAPEWTEHANLNFVFSDDPQSEIRVTFDENDGAWSYVGTDNRDIPLHAATLNLGWQDKGVILHEFGHMIGLSHEHQNPEGGIEWNEAEVISDLAGPPNFWTEQQTRHNVLNKYSADQLHGTEFDMDSVMLYAFPDEWTTNTGATRENEDLSDVDKEFVRSAAMYPGRQTIDDKAVTLEVSRGHVAEITERGEEDLFKFQVDVGGLHEIETMGTTDVVMVLFGPDSQTAKVAENDDGGEGTNARIAIDLSPGTYYAAVRHFSSHRTGGYRVRVSNF